MCGKCRNDKVWKAIRRKCSKVPDEIWLSWLSCLLVVKRNSQASQPVNAATEQQTVGTSKQCIATHGAVSHTVGSEKMLSESHSEFPTRTTMTTLRPHRISWRSCWLLPRCVSRHHVIHALRWSVRSSTLLWVACQRSAQPRTRLSSLPHAYQHVAASVLTWLTRELVFENNITRSSNKK